MTLAALCGLTAAIAITGRINATPRAHGQEQANATQNAEHVAFTLSEKPPKGAVLLFTGKPEQVRDNWYERYTTNSAGWTVSKEVASPNRHDITSKQEFGDAYIHAEFRCPVDAQGKPIGDGNSGIGLQGRYEIQISNAYGQSPESHGCGALYSQKAPLVVASKKAGEWQTYDIVFRAPRFDASGQVTEQPRATVFQNGILVQNNNAFLGMTGIQYGQYKEQTKTGPLILQGDHNPVSFRNVWVVPIPSESP